MSMPCGGFTAGLLLGEAAVKDLTARFDISQPAVSQHLATLRRACLVSERRDGRLVYYRVEPKGLRPLIDWIAHYQTFWLERVDRLQALLKEMDE
jgi:DNA-binding transcriptional ArsR family regulator